MLNIYNYSDYNHWIKDKIKNEKQKWGYQAKLAKAINCQPAYLSRCLAGRAHLTVDQAIAICQFWSLTPMETDYFLLLLEYDRAGSSNAKKFFKMKLQNHKEQAENLKIRLKRQSLDDLQKQALYYSHWSWMAVHLATTIKPPLTDIELSSRLQIPLNHISEITTKLNEWGLIEREENTWKFKMGDFHIGKESPLLTNHHQNWRQKAVLDSQNSMTDGLHFSAVYTLSKNDIEVIKNKVLNLIEDSLTIVKKSEEQEIVCFNIDFFKL